MQKDKQYSWGLNGHHGTENPATAALRTSTFKPRRFKTLNAENHSTKSLQDGEAGKEIQQGTGKNQKSNKQAWESKANIQKH